MGPRDTKQACDTQDSYAAALVSDDGILDQASCGNLDDESNEVKFVEKIMPVDV